MQKACILWARHKQPATRPERAGDRHKAHTCCWVAWRQNLSLDNHRYNMQNIVTPHCQLTCARRAGQSCNLGRDQDMGDALPFRPRTLS